MAKGNGCFKTLQASCANVVSVQNTTVESEIYFVISGKNIASELFERKFFVVTLTSLSSKQTSKKAFSRVQFKYEKVTCQSGRQLEQ